MPSTVPRVSAPRAGGGHPAGSGLTLTRLRWEEAPWVFGRRAPLSQAPASAVLPRGASVPVDLPRGNRVRY